MSASNLVNTDWVQEKLNKGEHLAIVDVRFSPQDSSYGRAAYEKGHLPGAVYVDFKKDLTDPEQQHGGRSPLPSPSKLAGLFSGLGIDIATTVVIYEDTNGPASARLWWILKYLGHTKVYILDGGYSAWIKAELPVSVDEVFPVQRSFEPEIRTELLVGVEEVRQVSSGDEAGVLIDARDPNQYAGKEAPFDPIAGHIPNAVNFFWKDSLSPAGTWKSAAELQEHFASLDRSQQLIVYCGSGISACPNILALEEAGFTNVKLYAGSWSDWISYEGNPVAIVEE